MSETTPRRPCQAFSATGRCKSGKRCKFVHQVVNTEASSSSGSPLNVPHNIRWDKSGNELCYFFKAGCCRKGDKCIWSHDLKDTPTPSVDSKSETKTKKTRQRRAQKEGAEALKKKEGGREALRRKGEEREALRRKEEERETLRRKEEEREALRRQEEERAALRRRKEEEEREARRKQREEEEHIAREAKAEARRKAQQARAEEERKARQAKIAEREATVVHRHVVMDGSTLVTCGAGLDVQNIVCGFDSCYLTIKNLPKSAKHQDIEELFTQQGVDKNLFYIVKMRRVNEDAEAKVMSDAEVGQAIAAGLDGMEFGDGNILDITVADGGVPNKMGSASERNANTVTVTWKIPSVSMIAEYDTPNAASNAMKRLNNSIFSGRKIRAELTRGPIDFTTSVKVWGLPLTVTEQALEAHSGAYLVRRLHPQPNFSTMDIERELRKTVEGMGNLEVYNITPSNPNKFIAEARIRFRTWEGAKRAHALLNQRRLLFDFPPFRAFMQEPIQYVITVPLAQYRAQKARWDSMVEGDNNKAAFIRIANNSTDRAFIRVLGEDKKAVGQLKVRVENLAGGEALGIGLWHSSFLGADGRRFLEGIGSRTKAYVRGDWKTKTLRLYADGDAKHAAITLIKAEVTRLESSEWSVSIQRRSIGFFMRKGLQMLKEELGEDAATLELDPPRLIIRGGEEARRMVDRLMEESRTGIESLTNNDDQDTCPICFDDVSSPVLLGCGHCYCTACLRHFLSSATEWKAFPLLCAGDEDRCKTPIAIPIIQRFLLQQQFDQLIEAAVTTYIEKQPNKFRYCTTPDCPQVYRCEGGRKALTCPSCFATVCTVCHKEAHEGMTCREREILNDKGEQERLNEEWARAAGAKRCPTCRVWIQKTEGCNHMTCQCGAHICWRCLATFPEAQAVYTHLNTAHGGIRDVEPEQAAGDFACARRLQREEEELARGRGQERAGLWAGVGQARLAAEELHRQQRERERQNRLERARQEAQGRRELEERAARTREFLARQERLRAEEQRRTRSERGGWCIIM